MVITELRASSTYISITLKATNNLGANIRAFEGAISFWSLFNEPVCSKEIRIEDPIPAKGTVSFRFNSEHAVYDFCSKLQGKKAENVKFFFTVERILLDNGTILRAKSYDQSK